MSESSLSSKIHSNSNLHSKDSKAKGLKINNSFAAPNMKEFSKEISKLNSWKGQSKEEFVKFIGSTPNSPNGKLLQSPLNRSDAGVSEERRSTSSIMQFVKMTDRYHMGGFRMQPTFNERTRQWIFEKWNKTSFIDLITKTKSQLPDPGKYPIKSTFVIKNFKFSKTKRVTDIQELIKINKWKIAPGSYFPISKKEVKQK